jgi:hypothetical protein
MSNALPKEFQANIRALRFMLIVAAVVGMPTILGTPWALLFALLAIILRPYKVPDKTFLKLVAFLTLPLCILLVPIFLEVQLWRVIKSVNAYETGALQAFTKDTAWKKKSFIRRYGLASSMIITMVALFLLLLPVPHTSSKAIELPYDIQHVQDASIELGESQTRQAGSKGAGLEQHREMKPLFAFIFGVNSHYTTSSQPTLTTQAPVNEIVAQGTKKYQYMWCSSGGYTYFTNDQFQSPNTGFTHKSKDSCVDKGYGHMTGLADTAPPQQTTSTVYTPSYRYTPTYTSCHEYTYINEFSCTTY